MLGGDSSSGEKSGGWGKGTESEQCLARRPSEGGNGRTAHVNWVSTAGRDARGLSSESPFKHTRSRDAWTDLKNYCTQCTDKEGVRGRAGLPDSLSLKPPPSPQSPTPGQSPAMTRLKQDTATLSKNAHAQSLECACASRRVTWPAGSGLHRTAAVPTLLAVWVQHWVATLRPRRYQHAEEIRQERRGIG